MLGTMLMSILFLSSAPSAEALSLGASARAFAKRPDRGHFSVQTGVSASGTLLPPARCKRFEGEDQKRCKEIFEARTASGQLKLETHGDFMSDMRRHKDDDRPKKTVTELETRVLKVLKQAVHTVAKAIGKACKQNNTEATAVTQCIAAAKSRVQLAVSAMIEAAFTAN